MFLRLMAWFMELRYEWGYSDIRIELKLGRPVRGHSCKYRLDPLAGDIVTNDDPKQV